MRTLLLRYFLVLALATATVSVKAQTYSFAPNKTLQISVKQNGEKENYIYVVNHKSTPLTVKWQLLHNTFGKETGWTYSFCDNVNCYLNIPSHSTMNSVDPGDSAFFKLAFDPQGVADSASMQFAMYDADSSSHVDTVTFVINSFPLGIEVKQISSEIKLYPNPAQDFISVDMPQSGFTPAYAAIYNITGEKVKELASLGQSSTINVNDLAPGAYCIRFTDKNGLQAWKEFYKTR